MEELVEAMVMLIVHGFRLSVEAVVFLLDLGFQSTHWRISFAALFGILFGLLAAINLGQSFGCVILVAFLAVGIFWDRYDDHRKD